MKTTMRRAPRRGDREFHELDPQAANNLLTRAVLEKQITGEDRAHITAFATEIVVSNNAGKSRHSRIVSILVNRLRHIGPYSKKILDNLFQQIPFLGSHDSDWHSMGENFRRDSTIILMRVYP